ncbi:hypothetical protein [Heyndrickxia coagulans]|uniref:hypothetical protein n=1 Tax=Heyndrickxia coagulans TaxID=1398 RepID=UPI00069AF8EA|nr:hypothetical protein [Heyndrickxia coagulans]
MWSKMKNLNFISRRLEKLWIKFANLICLLLSVVVAIAHYYGLIRNIRHLMESVINFSSIVIGIMGVFLSLIITLKESPVFERLRSLFPNLQRTIYISLRNQIYYGLIVVILSIFINSLPHSPLLILASIGVCVWFFFFWKLTLGSFYTVKLITDLVVRNYEVPKRKERI